MSSFLVCGNYMGGLKLFGLTDVITSPFPSQDYNLPLTQSSPSYSITRCLYLPLIVYIYYIYLDPGPFILTSLQTC